MIDKPFFVVLNHQKPNICQLLVDENDNILTYKTADEAAAAGKDNLLGHTFGFEVFERGRGE